VDTRCPPVAAGKHIGKGGQGWAGERLKELTETLGAVE